MITIKPLVTYRPTSLSLYYFAGTLRAFLIPEDHPDTENVVNGEGANTSEIVNFWPDTGVLETKNTIYMPAYAPSTPLVLPENPGV